LQTRLAQVPGLQVAGRTSSQAFKGKDATIAQIGKALDVGNVLEGSVRKDGQRLRVTMQLSNVATGFQTWTQTYDRKLTDVFAVQDDIAGAVVETLKLKLMAGGAGDPARRHTPSFEVYDVYLRAREAMKRTDGSTFGLALTLFTKATELDPDYADAWSGRAMAESFIGEASSDRARRNAARSRARPPPSGAWRSTGAGRRLCARGLPAHPRLGLDGALGRRREIGGAGSARRRNHLRKGFLLATLGPASRGAGPRWNKARAPTRCSRRSGCSSRAWRSAQGDYDGGQALRCPCEAIDPAPGAAGVPGRRSRCWRAMRRGRAACRSARIATTGCSGDLRGGPPAARPAAAARDGRRRR
jgi:hypothetical protein